MKKTISDVSLLDLIPFNFKDDPDTLNILKSIDHMLSRFLKNILEVILFDRIDELEEWKVDELSQDLHVDYYRSDLSIEQKRELVRTSLMTHRTKGTPFAVETIAKILFGEGEIQEWFEHGGDPYSFKVSTTGDLKNTNDYNKVIEAINIYKNLRSWLAGLIFKREDIKKLHVADISKRKTTHILNMAIVNIPEESILNNSGIVSREYRKIKVR